MMINSLFYGLEQSRRLLGILAIPELTFGIAELTYRILLRKAGKARIAIMVDSPYHLYDQTRFSITEAGVRDVIDIWHSELERMNDGKKGAQCDYPDSFIQFLGYMRIYFHLPYRQAEGVVRAHASNKLPSIPNYSTISRRVNNQDIRISEDVGNEAVIALDSTGIKVANRGEWMRHKWQVRRGYLKIHVHLLAHCKEMMEYQNGQVAIHTRFSKLITSLRTAVENGEGSLDKDATSHDDLLDAFRPSLMFWY
jgi:hypothetical protein